MTYAYIGGLKKETVLCALFNNARESEMGDNTPMNDAEATELLEKSKGSIGWYRGRALHLEFPRNGDPILNTTEYNQDHYRGVTKKTGERVRAGEDVVRDLIFGIKSPR